MGVGVHERGQPYCLKKSFLHSLWFKSPGPKFAPPQSHAHTVTFQTEQKRLIFHLEELYLFENRGEREVGRDLIWLTPHRPVCPGAWNSAQGSPVVAGTPPPESALLLLPRVPIGRKQGGGGAGTPTQPSPREIMAMPSYGLTTAHP